MKNRFEIRGNIVAILLERKDGTMVETIIDKDDLMRAQELSGAWSAGGGKRKDILYVKGYNLENGKQKSHILHRWLMYCPKGLQVDHINHDTLNNTRENLRNVTHAINSQNLKLQKDNSSGFRGVHWNKRSKKWEAYLRLHGIQYHLGNYETPEDADGVAHQARIEFMPGYVYEIGESNRGCEKINNTYISPSDFNTALENGIAEMAVKIRVKYCKWAIDKAITIPLQTKDKWNNSRDLATENGIGMWTFYRRILRGWTVMEASTRPVKKNGGISSIYPIMTKAHPYKACGECKTEVTQ